MPDPNEKPAVLEPDDITPSQRSTIASQSTTHDPLKHHGHLPSIKSIVEIIVVVLFVITFICQPFRIPSESMENTLLVGDFLLVDKVALSPSGHWGWLLPYRQPQRGEIVIFHYPVDPKQHLIKRIIGMPGDRLRLHNGQVSINHSILEEPYTTYNPSPFNNFRDNFPSLHNTDPDVTQPWWAQLRTLMDGNELIIPRTDNPNDLSYFAMGDNRNNSEDSRYWGFVSREAIVGPPLVIYFSMDTRVRWTRLFKVPR